MKNNNSLTKNKNQNQLYAGFRFIFNLYKVTSPEHFPEVVHSQIHDTITQDNFALFPCNCECYNNKIEVVISAVGDDDLTFEFDYSFESDSSFPSKKLEEYFLKLTEAGVDQICGTCFVKHDCGVSIFE